MPSIYNKNTITKKGYNLLAESIATKKPVIFTKVVIGDGDDTGLNIDTITSVVSEKLTLPVLSGKKDGDGQYLVTAILSNDKVEIGFFPKEVALFAKCGDDGEEILYSYSNGGNNVGLIPDKSTPINSEIYNIRTKIHNAKDVTFVTSDDTYITAGELEKHNTDEHAHDNRFKALEQTTQSLTSKVNGTLDKKYDKTGGVLSGDIILTGDSRKIKTDGSGFDLTILGGSEESNGAYIQLNGNGYPTVGNGQFRIVSSANGTKRELIGNIDGTLKWDGDNIIRKSMLATKDDTSALSQAPTLQLVKSLLSGLNIKSSQDVLQALGTETLQSLGVKYDFSNEKAWYICLGKLFGGLIIQGGTFYSDSYKTINFPISFPTKCMGVVKAFDSENKDVSSSNNVRFYEHETYKRTKNSFTIASTGPAVNQFYVAIGF